jgi:hypothetical protein
MALLTARRVPRPPRLALMTDGLKPLAATKSMAWMKKEKLPLPSSPSTFTA